MRIISKKYGFSRFLMNYRSILTTMCDKQQVLIKLQHDDYSRAIQDLNGLQTNSQTLALAKYKKPKEILPLFTKQLQLAGIEVKDLDKLNVIHVTGTKGKGSTCAFLESILRFSGENTGFYNSPHLVSVTERIRIGGKPIDDDKFTKYFRYVYDKLFCETKRNDITMPSYFSFLTILAFHIFIQEKVDCAVIEVGIGGEYDPTNIVQNPIACGITTLDYDHTNILGKTLDSITHAKAGIIKRGVPLFTVSQEKKRILDIIKSRTIELESSFHICKPLDKMQDFNLGIQGQAQRLNAAIACQLAKYYLKTKRPNKFELIDDQNLEILHSNLACLPNFFKRGLIECNWPGRCQIKNYSRFTFFLDGAHTRKSMDNCLDWFLNYSRNNHPNSHMILMLNVIGDRDKREVLEPLARFNGFEKIIFSTNKIDSGCDRNGSSKTTETFTTFQADKSMDNVYSNVKTWNNLLEEIKQENGKLDDKSIIMTNTTNSIKYLVELSNSNPSKKYHILVTGSLHFVGAILETLPKFENILL